MVEAFVSHSRKDLDFVNHLYKILYRSEIKPNIAEFEEVESGKLIARDIGNMIHRSTFFLLFLSNNVTYSEHTKNWISWELGCAYGAKTRPPQTMKDLFVFESFNQINFPIPHLDYYILFEPTTEGHWSYIEHLLTSESIHSRKLFGGIRPSDEWSTHIKCPNCNGDFKILSNTQYLNCPICRKNIYPTWRKIR